MTSRDDSPPPDLRMVPVRDELADAVQALSAGQLFAYVLTAAEELEPDAAEELRERVRALARKVVDRALGGRGAPSAVELREAASSLMEEVEALAGPALKELLRSAEAEEVLAEVGLLLREAALESLEMDVALGRHPEQGLLLTALPVTRHQAHVWLLGALYDRLEEWVARDALLMCERVAVDWWFSRWTPARTPPEHEFAQGVREQELALVDRPFLGLGGRTLVEALEEDGELDGLPEKQRRMARGLRDSVVGVWEVSERDGERVVLRGPLDGSTYEVREHAPEQPYGTGALALGRLIPFGDGTWLRSPGMLIVPGFGDRAEEMAEAMEATDGLPECAVVEGLISSLGGYTRLPRELPPAPGVREAKEAMEELTPLLVEEGIATEAAPDDIPPGMDLSRLPADGKVYDFAVDVVMADWMQALGEMARKADARKARKEKRKKEGKKRRRR